MTALRAVLVTPLSGPLARFGSPGASALRLWATHAPALAPPWTSVDFEVVDAHPSAAAAMREAVAGKPDVLFGPYGAGPAVAALQATRRVVWNHGGATARLRRPAFGHVLNVLAPAATYFDQVLRAISSQHSDVRRVSLLHSKTGWLNGVLAEHLAIDLSLHIRPLDGGAAASALKLKSWRLGGALNDDAANGRPIDNHLTTALEQIERLRRGLARRETALFSVGLYLQLRASSRAELDELTQRAAGLFAAQAGATLVPRLQQEQGFRACLPEARDALQVLHTLDTDTLSTMYPFVPATPRMPGGILFGIDEQIHD